MDEIGELIFMILLILAVTAPLWVLVLYVLGQTLHLLFMVITLPFPMLGDLTCATFAGSGGEVVAG